MLDARQKTYFAVRGAAAGGFVLSAAVLPRGIIGASACVLSGVVAVLSCLWTNAGSVGERAGARPQDRHFQQLRAPQGDWPPYDPGTVVEGELAPDRRSP